MLFNLGSYNIVSLGQGLLNLKCNATEHFFLNFAQHVTAYKGFSQSLLQFLNRMCLIPNSLRTVITIISYLGQSMNSKKYFDLILADCDLYFANAFQFLYEVSLMQIYLLYFWT